ncbi:hypothetical protein J6Z37_00275, partial [Candidatus Saccharibacteria bacterium]|nr:hypothetical protein [Candidatus Saccharibacteria bacterium]
DSSYNAHLISVESIVEMVKSMKAPHKWLIIGDMIEQGKIEGEEHTKLAKILTSANPEQIILIGRRTKKYTYPAIDKDKYNVVALDNVKQALKFIKENTTGKEVLVFKGSQYLEWLIEKLLDDPADVQYLARRDAVYVKRREKRGLN